jgi:hypothetical protein
MARQFIPNIDTANEEIVRLDTELSKAIKPEDHQKVKDDLKKAQDDLAAAPKAADVQSLKDELKKAQDDTKAAQDLLDAAPKAEDLKKAQDGQKAAEDKLKVVTDKVNDLAQKADGAMRLSLEAAAAAGVGPVKDDKATGIDAADDAKSAAAEENQGPNNMTGMPTILDLRNSGATTSPWD